MAISFGESLKKAAEESYKSKDILIAPLSEVADEATVNMRRSVNAIDVFTVDSGSWTLSNKYLYYTDYSDEAVSVVDENKNIAINSGQINLTQESNSQFIPFEMSRYYDGFDLVNTNILFHFVNRNGFEDYANPINVYYSNDRIRFAWLVDKRVTAVDGVVNFEIQAVGVNSKGDEYVWKTKPCNSLNILKSLAGNGVIEPDNSWMTGFLTQVTEHVASAQAAAQNAQNSISTIKTLSDNAAASAQAAEEVVATAEARLEESVGSAVKDKVNTVLAAYYTIDQIDAIERSLSGEIVKLNEALKNTDGLANFSVEYDGSVMTFYNGEDVIKKIEINSDPSEEWTEAYTKSVQDNYYNKTETYNIEQITEKLKNVTVDLTGYAKESYVDNKMSPIASAASANATNISNLSKTVVEMQDVVKSIDTSPRVTYDIVYNDLEDENSGENKLVLYSIENEGTDNEVRTPKRIYTIAGGNGGTDSSNKLYINLEADDNGNKITSYVYTLENVANNDAFIRFGFSGFDSSGDSVSYANSVWSFRKRTSGPWKIIAEQTVYPADNLGFNVSKHIVSAGTYQFKLDIRDDTGGFASKTWTVQLTDLRLEVSLDDNKKNPVGTLSFDYTPHGAITKDVHFILDGEPVGVITTSASGIPMPYTLPAQAHGSHLLEAYITADINGHRKKSNTVLKDILFVDVNSRNPVISCSKQKITVRQHDITNIYFTVADGNVPDRLSNGDVHFTVYDPSTEFPTVVLKEDGVVVFTKVLENGAGEWQYKSNVIGDHTLTISCGETTKTLYVTVEKLNIELEPVVSGLVFDFNPTGRSNSSTDREWSDGDISMLVSDDFDWVNGGYQYDENGDRYFCIKAGTFAIINHCLFGDDAKRDGKEFKFVFKTTNVQRADATFLHCLDDTIGSDHIGIKMNVHEAYIYGKSNSLYLPYSENDIIEFEFNISKKTEAVPMVMGYEDGVSTRPMVYDDAFDFTQNTPKYITLGSDYCDLHIYRFKVYNTSLDARGILNNFIADARNVDEMIARYNRNQIYVDNMNLDPDILAERCPWLRVYKLSAPYFTNKKSNKIPGTTIQQIYINGDSTLDNWTCYNAQHSGQGTTSDEYGAAGRNIDFIMNKSGVDGVDPYFVLGDGSEATEITLTRTSVPVAYLNFKANIASSNNMTNAMLASRYDEFEPYNRPFVREEGVNTSYIRDTMQFANAVVFIQETDEDLSTHREFADTAWHFYAIGNIGDSKKTDKTRLNDPNDRYECCVEIMNVKLPLSDWPVDTMYNAMSYKTDETSGERIYTWAKDQNLGILYEKINGEYVLTKDTSVDLSKTYYVDILEHDDFSENYTYGWRYLFEDGTDEENADAFNYCKQKWIEMYRFVTTSSNEEFKAHIGDYFVIDSALYYYLFTTRYCMVDNRAKNSFWHYAKTGEIDEEGNPIRKWDLTWGYDMDTALGLNNYGMQVYRYGLEDTDYDENGEEVFREADSTFFCRIRDLFVRELRAMYNTLESQGAWHAESFINKADAWQGEFPEELWRIDIERKYIRSYNESFINGEGDSQFLKNMCNGRMKYHRRQWERAQEKYMASKYQSNVAASDNATLRCTIPSGNPVVAPDYSLKLTPYDYIYLNVKYGTSEPIQVKGEPGVERIVPFMGDASDISIYSSSVIQSLGDLSTFYPATVNTSKASKIKELIIGNSTPGYDNPSLTTLTLGANDLLEVLNVENVSGLTQTLEISALHNLRELYAHGSNVGGVTFADGGNIEIAKIPDVNAVTMKNLAKLTDLDFSSKNKLTKLVAENCNTLDLLEILNTSPNLNRVRITGVDWRLEDASLLERIYNMSGVDNSGYNIDRAVLAGSVHVTSIKQKQLDNYNAAWPNLEIVPETVIPQFTVSFRNYDGTLLDVQYIDIGYSAVDPIHRDLNPIDTPVRENTVSHTYEFDCWDSAFTDIKSDRDVYAIYKESIRYYTIKYVSKGNVLQETLAPYGDTVLFNGDIPTYTNLETVSYTFFLFKKWDKLGYVDGDKTINAIFDEFQYTENAFDGKELSNMRPVEIYAMVKLGLVESVVKNEKDGFEITLGHDIDFGSDDPDDPNNIYSNVVISETMTFDGTNYYDTGIKLFDEDRDFVLAIDYEFLDGNSTNSVLAQCFQYIGSNGFKLLYAKDPAFDGARFTWGTSTKNIVAVGKREVLVMRHKKGQNNIQLYLSNMDGNSATKIEIERTKPTSGDCSLIFGCEKTVDGYYENYGIGKIHWCKLWYADFGDPICEKLVAWPHEKVIMEASGVRRYYLTDDPYKRTSLTLLAGNLLHRTYGHTPSGTNSNSGGFANSLIYKMLNERLYYAIPDQIRSLIKKAEIPCYTGGMSSNVIPVSSYITIPSCAEVSSAMSTDPYINEGKPITHFTDNNSRRRALPDGTYAAYWLRSPNNTSNSWYYRVNAAGDLSGFVTPYTKHGVLIEFSI